MIFLKPILSLCLFEDNQIQVFTMYILTVFGVFRASAMNISNCMKPIIFFVRELKGTFVYLLVGNICNETSIL